MALGYDGKLFILAFDHRGSFQKKMFGIEGDPSPEETDTISDAKKLIYEGMEKAVERGLDASSAGVLVDEQFGSDIPELAPQKGLSLTMPAEKSGQIEVVDTREDAQMLSDQARKGDGRENVKCVLLGRGASDEKVDHWLREAAPVDGFIGFAIGRSIWWNALKGYLDEELDRETAASQIAENYLR